MFERFTTNARRTVSAAVRIAAETGATRAGPEHLLLGLADDAPGTGAQILAEYGVTAAVLRAAMARPTTRRRLTDEEISALRAVDADVDEVFRRIEQEFGPAASVRQPEPPAGRDRRGWFTGPLDARARTVLELCLRETVGLRHREISSGHLLLALLRHKLTGPVSETLTRHGVTYPDARRRVILALRRAT
ncbi:Clp protease N-terminal domain-containing protein [Plantactinospora sp. BB1]|uniref:Clp protease N-terminal domain-containing protein n=1 Tax=Plantactinospora sp. BB1 TaxID=2071627 RepID=UPI000D16CF70|nr:Clp protease N-terminal domain-containing protein [Plantactinospora sp. BB1]AVT38296.1 Clp protease [Plantactinospora sp. BB1]